MSPIIQHSIPQSLSSWDEFDHVEYRERNYGKQLLPEDRSLISACLNAFETLGITHANPIYRDYIDIGAGPNLYPSMLIAPLVKHDGKIRLIDYATPNITYLQSVLDMGFQHPTISGWKHFEDLMVSISGPRYNNVLHSLFSKASVAFGDIYNLPENCCDVATAFFVAESITQEYEEFRRASNRLQLAVRAGGLLVSAHMIGSRGWYAGEGTNFPAIDISISDLRETYDQFCDATIVAIDSGEALRARSGYTGMALVIATRKANEA